MRINYDFSDLEAFLAVKESGSFQAAAQQLNVSQPAITRRIQKLEAELDAVLFERSTRAVKATLVAKRLQPRAEAILNDAREMTAAIVDESAAYASQRNAIVTIAMLPSVVALLLPAGLEAFNKTGMQARVRLIETDANGVAEAVAQGEADFGVSALPTLEPNTEFEPLFNDPIGVVLTSEHPLNSKDSLSWSDLQSHALIVPARGTGNRLLIDEAAAKQRLQLQWMMEVQRSTTALELVHAGIGLALLPRSAVTYLQGATVNHKLLRRPGISRPVGILTRRRQINTAAALNLMNCIKAKASSQRV